METAFLAFSFRNEDGGLADAVGRLLASHNIRVVTSETLGGADITPAVRTRIEKADGLIGLLTRREQLTGGGWRTHDWVRDELNIARQSGKPCIALVENGVKLEGAYSEREYIALERDKPLPAFLQLSETIREWKEQIGRTIIVRIQPPEAAELAAQEDDQVRCRYRFVHRGDRTDWLPARAVEEPGGTFLYVRGARDGHLIEVAIESKSRGVAGAHAPSHSAFR